MSDAGSFFGTSEFAVRPCARWPDPLIWSAWWSPLLPSERARTKADPKPGREGSPARLVLVVATSGEPERPCSLLNWPPFNPTSLCSRVRFHPQDAAATPARQGFLNIHPPCFPGSGRRPDSACDTGGEHKTGVTVIVLSEQVDAAISSSRKPCHRPGRNCRRAVAEACRCWRPLVLDA